MKLKRNDIELLAPVGNFEALIAAVQSDVDAVYFGVNQLNMRVKSSKNFILEDIPEIVNICRQNKIKTYLTLNTLMYDKDLNQMKLIADNAKQHDVDAIIATDISTIQYIKNIGLPVHISTQQNISNIEAVRFYSNYADVMILARELTLDQVNNIYNQIVKDNIRGPSGNLMKIELFVHGALCMSISGKCYLSLHQHNLSANRGLCLQDCRRGYIVTEKETDDELEIDNEYIMSPKDLCTIGFLNKILDAGVRVLKIEGRARSPEYVKTVSTCYNEAIDAYINEDFSAEKIQDWKKRLSMVFNRGFWDGYYLGQRLGEWSNNYGSSATKRKIYIGKGMNYFSNIKVAEFLVESGEISVGDDILIIGPTTGVVESKIKEIRVDLKNVNKAIKGDHFSIPLNTLIRRSDKLYKLVKATKNIVQ